MSLISVVVPCYNHARYIGDALASVYRQTYQSLELIIVDDQSTDGTFRLAEALSKTKEYRSRFKRIVCVQNSANIGAHNTINAGLALSRGRWISLLNSDDTYHFDRIKKLFEHAVSRKAQFAFSGLDFLYESDIPWSDRVIIKQISEAQKNYVRYPSMKEALFHFNFCATTGNMFLKKEVFRKLGGFSDLKYCHDWDFIMRASDNFTLTFLPEKLYSYRLHGTNSFKSLADIGRRESELVAKGVRARSSNSIKESLSWDFGVIGLLSGW